MSKRLVYHLVAQSCWRRDAGNGHYRPPGLAREGFIHCCGEVDLLVPLAGDYFAGLAEPLLVLVIDSARLAHQLRFEAPAPIPGGGTTHLVHGRLFPHLYGPLNLDAVVRIETLPRIDGCFRLPATLTDNTD